MKKLVAFMMAATMMVSMGVGASAVKLVKHSGTATSTAQQVEGYGIKVSDKSIELSQNGKVLSTRKMKTTKVTLLASKDDGVAVQYSADTGKLTKVALGSDVKVIVSGTLDTLTIAKSLNAKVLVTIPKAAKIGELKVDFSGNVQVDGTVNKIDIATKNATVTASDTATVGKVSSVSKSSFIGKATGATTTAPAPTTPATGTTTDKTTTDDEGNPLIKTMLVEDVKESMDGITFRCDIDGANIIINGKNHGTTSKGKNTVLISSSENVTDISIEKTGYTPITFGITGFYTDKQIKDGELSLFA